jgi:hypothetical protein
MSEQITLTRFLESALALAHAALDDPSERNVGLAHMYAAEAQLRVKRPQRRPWSDYEAAHIAALLQQLRLVLATIDRRQDAH